MRDPHSFAIRTFVIGGLMLFAAGLFFIGKRHNLFNRNFEVYTEFDRLNGLQKGAKVRVSGMDAGEVLEAEVPNRPDGRFRVRVRIRQDFHVLVRRDSVATIRTPGLAGSSFMDIEKGTQDAPESGSGSTIPSKEPFDIGDLMQQGSDLLKAAQTGVGQLRASAERTLHSIDSAAEQTGQAVVAVRPDLEKLVSSARRASDDLSEMMAQVEQGQGTIGKLLKDPKLAGSVDQTVENARQAAINVNSASTRMNATMADLEKRDLLGRAQAVLEKSRQLAEDLDRAIAYFKDSPLGSGDAAAELRDTIASARITANNLADDTEALKHNFLFRRFFKKRGYFNLDRMNPAEYARLLQEHSYKRVWLTRNELFSTGPDGKEKLTKEGERRIDDAMSGLVPYLTDDPIVVEGYSTGGSAGERFLRARQRAFVVQIYIKERFGLPPNTVGAMPMSGSLSSIAGKSSWNGVSLVLIR